MRQDVIRWKRYLLIAAAVVVLVPGVLTGCAGGETTSSGSQGTGGTALAEDSKEAIVIGEIAALTGPTALNGIQEQKGAQLAEEEINRAGGVLGRPVRLVTLDFAGKAEEGVSAYKRLVQQEKAVAVIGTNFSNVNIAMAPVTDQFQVPVLSNAIDIRATTQPNGKPWAYSFLAQPSSISWGKSMAKVALEVIGAKTAAILVDSGLAYATSQADPFEAYFTNHGGKIVAKEAYAAGTTDFKALLTKIKNARPDVILIPQYGQAAGLATVQARELGIQAAILGPNTFSTSDYTNVAGAAIEGVYFVNNVDMGDTAFTDFFQRFEAFHKEPPKTVNTMFGYDNMYIVKAAIEKAGAADPQKIRNALESIRGVRILQGNGTFTMNPVTHRPKDMPVTVFQYKNGKPVNLGKIQANEEE